MTILNKFYRYFFVLMMCTLITSCGDDDSTDDSEDACDVAVQNTVDALSDFQNASDAEEEDACNDYIAALNAQIVACGDEDGTLQAQIDGTDCSVDQTGGNASGTLSVTAGTLPIDFDVITVTEDNGLIEVMGEIASPNFSNTISFKVPDGSTGADIDQDFEILLISMYEPYREGGQFDFQFEITTNTSGRLVGSFFGGVERSSSSGSIINLTRGVIDIQY